MKKITELTEDTFATEVLQANQPVVVDFYAPWCGPCQMLAPLLDSLADRYQGKIKFVKLNVDLAFSLAKENNVTGVPTLVGFANGLFTSQLAGLHSLRSLLEWLDDIAAKNQQPLTTQD